MRKFFTKEELISLLKNKVDQLGHEPTMKEVDEDKNMPSSSAYRNHFGSYRKTFTVLKNKAAR